LKNTHDVHPDYAKLTVATKKVQDIAGHVNEAKRREENMLKILEIQKNVAGCEVWKQFSM
jgi:hypothetical protein